MYRLMLTIPQLLLRGKVHMKCSVFLQCLCCVRLVSAVLFATDESAAIPAIYSQIKDIYHPTLDEYRAIQNYLVHGEREEVKRLHDYNYENVVRNFKIIGSTQEELPTFEIINVNSELSEKENCVLVYASFNRNYLKGLNRLVTHLKESDFKGHILCRQGGFPNVEGGSLVLAHVPYAFKVSFFKEAQRLGYKRAFWLDTAVVPLVSLNAVFKEIQEKGYFVMGNTHMVGPFITTETAAAFGVTLEETARIPFCSAGIFGVDFTNERAVKVIDSWYKAAYHKDAFFSSRPEQAALSIILYQMGIFDFVSISRMPHVENGEQITADSLFLLDRRFVHY